MEPIEVTDQDIRQLQAEASAARDRAQVAICQQALGVLGYREDWGDDADAYDRAAAMTQAEARYECARVIADARAQQERQA